MNNISQDKIFALKLFQFLGGLISVIVGTILVAWDIKDPARFNLGFLGLELGISAISGVAVIIAGIFLFFRSGGGIKVKSEKEGPWAQSKDRIEFTVDAHKDYQPTQQDASIKCPHCNQEVEKADIFLFCTCSNCKNEWKQRIPS